MSFPRHLPYSKPIHKGGGRGTSYVVPFVLAALNRVNVVEMTFGVDGPKIRLTRVDHVPCHYAFMFPRRSSHARLRARGVWAAGLAGPPARPGQRGGLGGGTPPNGELALNYFWDHPPRWSKFVREPLLLVVIFPSNSCTNKGRAPIIPFLDEILTTD